MAAKRFICNWRMVIAATLTLLMPGAHAAGDVDWPHYLGDAKSSQYSALDQINTGNVARLERVWTYHSGGEAQIQCNPLIVEGLLFGVSAERSIFALHAATGLEAWRFTPPDPEASRSVSRGVAYWRNGSSPRIIAALGRFLYALDARTGAICKEFGEQGAVDIREAFDRDAGELSLGSTTPGIIYRDSIIVTTRVSEARPAAPGDILCFDLRTGQRKWIFHTIPHPGEAGYDAWPPEAWKTAGGANCWAGMSLDEARGMVFVPTGSAAYDFYGADREGENLFANCLIALDAETGARKWHYQFVRHDLWDRDLPAPPNLVTVTHGGKQIDAVAQITKSGHVFVFDRDTGTPLFPIEEVAAPPSDIPGEKAWPKQPLPLKPPAFARQQFTEDLVTDRSPAARDYVLEILRRVRSGPPFTPPSLEGTVIYPGFDGGGEWGGAAFDADSGWLYVNSTEMPWILTLFEIAGEAGEEMTGRRVYATNCVHCHGVDLRGDPLRVFPPIEDLRGKYTMEQMGEIVRLGKERMPSFSFLSDAEVTAVLEYICGLEEATRHGESSTAMAEIPAEGERWYNTTGYNRFVDQDGYPAVKPPWGTLNAIDLNAGEIVWQVPLGETPELAAQGYRYTGTENYGGPVVTAGGLVFIAATKDERIRAFDKKTGEVLWEAVLPKAGYATPATYMMNGRQYVVVAAAGGKIGSPAGDAYVAFALPE